MLTALLIDGTDNPIAVRIREDERTLFLPTINMGVAGGTPRQFKEVRQVGDFVLCKKNDLSTEVFERSAGAVLDTFVNADKYRGMGKEPDAVSSNERKQLAEYRRRFGPLEREV